VAATVCWDAPVVLLLLCVHPLSTALSQHWQAAKTLLQPLTAASAAACHQVSLEPESLPAVGVSADAAGSWKGDLLAVAVTSDADLQTTGEHIHSGHYWHLGLLPCVRFLV
jgi:hypothetical protein